VIGLPIRADDIVQRCEQVRVAQAVGDDAVDVRELAVDRVSAINPDNRTDANRRVERGPEVELVGRIGAPLGRNHPAKCRRFFIASH
jgi:hypothetical protein